MKMATRRMSSWGDMRASVLESDDLLDEGNADELQEQRAGDHLHAERIPVERRVLLGVQETEEKPERRRQARQHPPRDASVRGNDSDLALHLEPIANDRGEVVEHF